MRSSNHLTQQQNTETHATAPARRGSTQQVMDRQWLGLKELTQYADLSERTIRSWIYSAVDPLPAAKVCGKVLVRKSDFDAYLQRHRIKRLDEINLDATVQDAIRGVAHGR